MRLIDADALPVKFWFGRFFGVAEIDIVNAPTVDAVEVVRCKDCKWSILDKVNGVLSCWTGRGVDDNDYCSNGERKEEVTDGQENTSGKSSHCRNVTCDSMG